MPSYAPEEGGPDTLAGTTLADRFELLAFAARGGMGRVYRARDRVTGHAVAVKVLPDKGGDAQRFAREAEVLASIDHPGVVRYLAHGETEIGQRYLAMEWLSGEDLAERLEESTLTVDETLDVARHAAEALAAAHRRGVVHRDLKPANLFLVGRDLTHIKLLDFGVAFAPDDVELTSAGTLVGTPAYMAPEQVRGELVQPATDVYGVGAVLFRCLTGRPPFHGAHRLAVLAKILLEPPASIRESCPEVPGEVEALVARLLSKDPDLRPADGAALAEELRGLGAVASTHVGKVRSAISARERRVACVVLCARTSSEEDTVVGEAALREVSPVDDIVRRAVEQRGGTIDALAKGAFVISIPGASSPVEQASRAVRCALALGALRPKVPLFVATGRVLVSGSHRVGEVIDRATDAWAHARETQRRRGVWVDTATADLLAGQFELRGEGDWREVVSEEDAATPVRRLLGRPAPCIGRETPLAMLSALRASAGEESHARAALITGAPGLGKTRLVSELLQRVTGERADLLFARGDPMRAGSAFGAAGELIKRAAGILDSDPLPDRVAKLHALASRDAADPLTVVRRGEILGEICGVLTPPRQASPALRAARADVSVMADAIRETFAEWIGARAERCTVSLVVEDVHWVDSTSLRLFESTFAALEERPVFFLGTSRPEGVRLFTQTFRDRGLVELTLAPLSKTSSERLVREALGEKVDETVVARLVALASGHPFYLEELVRAAASGRDVREMPDTILGMVQARLDDLDGGSRLLLRAASVFGDPFFSGGLHALMGDDMPGREVDHLLGVLVDRELLTEERHSSRTGERELRFRHALLREGAYATLPERDKARAHKRAAAWLEATGEKDPAVLAEHYDRGMVTERAQALFRDAAAQALQRNDLERALAHATRARARGVDDATDASLSAIEAEVHYWRGELAPAVERGTAACRRLDRGSLAWFDAVSATLGALGQLGRNDEVAAWLDQVAYAPFDEETRGALVVALCRGMAQLLWAHHEREPARLRDRLDALTGADAELDAFERGWVRRVRGEAAWVEEGHVDHCLEELRSSCADFEEARATRALCLTRLNAASLAGCTGETELALGWLALSRAEASRLGSGFLLAYALAVEGLVLAFSGDPAGEGKMASALAALGGSPRLSFLGRVIVGWLMLERGEVEAAAAHADAALAIPVAADLFASGVALAARVARARGQETDGLRLAREAFALESSRRDLEVTFGMAGVTLAEALVAAGDLAGARATLIPLTERLAKMASTIASADRRQRFWDRPVVHAPARRLALTLGLAETAHRS